MLRQAFQLLAVMAPILLGGLAAWSWSRPDPREVSSYSDALDALLAAAPPRWVIVGNSKAKQDVVPRQLSKELSFDGQITPVVLNGSTAPAWYAMLEQRVFGEGYRPELVVVYGQLGAMLRDQVLTDTERHSIEGLSDKPSAILETRVFGLATSGVGRAHERAFRGHESTVTALRELTIGGLFASPSGAGLREAGRLEGGLAWEAVYGADAGVRTSGNTRMVPGEATSAPSAMAANAAGTEFVDAILRLCHRAGARVLFVRAPVGAQVRGRDDVPAEVEAALYAHINAAGASWIDLHAINLPSGAFRDDFHLLPAGAEALTAALAERMLAANVPNGGVAPAAPPFRPTSVVREGTPPALSVGALSPMRERACGWRASVSGLEALADDALLNAGLGGTSPFLVEVDGTALAGGGPVKDFGVACSGAAVLRADELRISPASGAAPRRVTLRVTDAPSVASQAGLATWWVPPGMTLRWTFAAPPPGEAPRVEAVIRALAGSTATMWVNDAAVPFTARGRVLRAEAPVPRGEWRLGVEAGADTWLVVHSLAAVGVERSFVVGGPWAETHLLQSRPRFGVDPVASSVIAVDEGEGLWRLDLPALATFADDHLLAVSGSRCSPVEVSVDGEAFPKAAHATLWQLRSGREGVAHEGGSVWVRHGGVAPIAYRLNPQRSCIRGGKYFPGWLYDGDAGVMTVAGKRLGAHPLGIDTLRVDALAVGGDTTLKVVVTKRGHAGWEVEWEGQLEFAEAAGRTQLSLRVEPRLGVEGKREVELRVSGGNLLAFDAVLSESEGGQ